MSRAITESCGRPAWAETLPHQPPPRPLSGRLSADFAVIGAGVTGLGIAHELARLAPEKGVAVLDSVQVGFTSSGRNFGSIMDIPTTIRPWNG